MESSFPGTNSFTASNPDWKEGTYENFKKWSLKQFALDEKDSEDEAEVPVMYMKAKDITFEKNKRGEFVLPPIHEYRTAKQRQRVIRGYIGAVYSI